MDKIVKFLSLLEGKYKEWYLIKHFKGDIWLYESKSYEYKRLYSWCELLLTPMQTFMLGLFENYSYQNEPIRVKNLLRTDKKISLENGIVKGV